MEKIERMFVPTRWNCPQCATQDIDGDVCPNCGCYRNGASGAAAAGQFIPAGTFRPTADEDVFVLNRRNTAYVFGRARRVGFYYTWWFLLSALAMTLLIAFTLATAFNEWNRVTTLEQSGIRVKAIVSDHRTVSGKSTSYYLTYRFSVRNQQYQREQNVGSGTYNRFPPGAPITISYLASDPSISMLAGDAEDNSDLVSFTIIFALVDVGGLIMAGYLGVRSLRYRRLSRDGKLLRGEVLACTGLRGYKGAYTVSLRYAFRDPGGQNVEKLVKTVRNDLKKKGLPRPGTPVAVMYVDESLYEVL